MRGGHRRRAARSGIAGHRRGDARTARCHRRAAGKARDRCGPPNRRARLRCACGIAGPGAHVRRAPGGQAHQSGARHEGRRRAAGKEPAERGRRREPGGSASHHPRHIRFRGHLRAAGCSADARPPDRIQYRHRAGGHHRPMGRGHWAHAHQYVWGFRCARARAGLCRGRLRRPHGGL